MKGAKKVPEKKQQTVAEFSKLVSVYPIVGIVNMENLPTKQLQTMRAQLSGTVLIRMTKKRLMKIILEKVKADKKDIDKLIEHLRGMPAMIFTKENPFTLYKKLEQNKSSAPAKAGQKPNKDIVVPAGPTPFSPGPIIGELGQLRIKTGIEDGKVAIKETVTVVKDGEEISPNVASILSRLGIEPMEIGLDLVAVYEDGSIFTKDVLAIDETEFINKITMATNEALSLALGIAYATADTINTLIQKAYNDAKAVGIAQDILADDLVSELISKAETETLALKAQLNLPEVEKAAEPEKTAEEPKEEKPAEQAEETVAPEEKQEEAKPEEAPKEEQPAEQPEPAASEETQAETKPEEPDTGTSEKEEEQSVEEKPSEEPAAPEEQKEEAKPEEEPEKPSEQPKEDKPAEQPEPAAPEEKQEETQPEELDTGASEIKEDKQPIKEHQSEEAAAPAEKQEEAKPEEEAPKPAEEPKEEKPVEQPETAAPEEKQEEAQPEETPKEDKPAEQPEPAAPEEKQEETKPEEPDTGASEIKEDKQQETQDEPVAATDEKTTEEKEEESKPKDQTPQQEEGSNKQKKQDNVQLTQED